MLNTKNVVIAYAPAQLAKHVGTYSEVQFPLKDVDFSRSLVGLPPWKIAEVIRVKIKIKMEEIGKRTAVHDFESSSHMKDDEEKEREGKSMGAYGITDTKEEAGFVLGSTDVAEDCVSR
jgi:hypothetical protein